ncbi:MAG: hypothetical protein KYX69_09765 [Sphingomonas sp.]|uniref:hypothetical protein n=1 Tax=Sphingomonas sp. TaxID=28214 RepID=UPI002637518D|nr:hypothetical protein [Sphingomonas sp.]MDK2767989.1 hypothetical protein [Sphingomonas sp.]
MTKIDSIVPLGTQRWRRQAFLESGAHHWLVVPLAGAERFAVGAFRFWKWCRMTASSPLPNLHRRLAPVGGAMLAVPLDDLFGLIADFCACARAASGTSDRILGSDEVTLLTVLHAGTEPDDRLVQAPQDTTRAALLLIAGWSVRHEMASELGLTFGSLPKEATADVGRTSLSQNLL